MKYEIKHQWDGRLLFEAEVGSLKLCIELAVKSGANLYGARLSGANLSGANLSGANLDGANLSGANLSGARLSGANLSGANLYGARLDGANLSDANLYGARLSGANLDGANLSGANLDGANLSGARLDGANLSDANLSGARLDGANLSGANLDGSCLGKYESPFQWATSNSCPMRVIGSRTLVLGSRTQDQPTMRGPDYELDRLYFAPVFSQSRETDCHPGLYIAGGPGANAMLVAFWLDEMCVTSTKLRVPRFRTLSARDGFDSLTASDMDGGAS